jgi:guanine deaminase
MKDNNHQQFMQMAIDLAQKNVASGKGGPFGAVVAKNGKIIATAVNEVTSTNDPTAHAEVLAIRRACASLHSHQLDGCMIYCSCEPCPMCLGAIYWSRPAKVYYAAKKEDAAASGFDDDFIYHEIDLPHPDRKIPFINIGREESLKVFRFWDKSDLKIAY